MDGSDFLAGDPNVFVLATFNRDKLRELRTLFAGTPITLRALSEFSGASAPGETGTTLEQNARAKAEAAMSLTGHPAIADDTGLEVDALGGRPGVYTARFAGPGASYAENVHRLLEVLTGRDRAQRTARFRTVMVACFPDAPDIVAEGVLEGFITDHPRGREGFGYDPVFEVADLGRTLAELEPQDKNRISHRARAALELARRIEERALKPRRGR